MSDYMQAMQSLAEGTQGPSTTSATAITKQDPSSWLDAYGQNNSKSWSDYYDQYKQQFSGESPGGFQGGGYQSTMQSGPGNAQFSWMLSQQKNDLMKYFDQMAKQNQQGNVAEQSDWMKAYFDQQQQQTQGLLDYLKSMQAGQSQAGQPQPGSLPGYEGAWADWWTPATADAKKSYAAMGFQLKNAKDQGLVSQAHVEQQLFSEAFKNGLSFQDVVNAMPWTDPVHIAEKLQSNGWYLPGLPQAAPQAATGAVVSQNPYTASAQQAAGIPSGPYLSGPAPQQTGSSASFNPGTSPPPKTSSSGGWANSFIPQTTSAVSQNPPASSGFTPVKTTGAVVSQSPPKASAPAYTSSQVQSKVNQIKQQASSPSDYKQQVYQATQKYGADPYAAGAAMGYTPAQIKSWLAKQ